MNGSPLVNDMTETSDTGSPFPFHFPMGFQLDRFKEFMLQCSRENVADITVQSGDYLWGRHNRTYIRLSDRPIQVPEMELVISGLYATTGLAELMAGKALDWRASAEESREVVR